MARLTAAQIEVHRREQDVSVRLPVDGRARLLVFDAREALRISNALGNAAADALGADDVDGLPVVSEMRMIPFGREAGPVHAALRFQTNVGPIILKIDAKWLLAMQQAASAALELGEAGGSA